MNFGTNKTPAEIIRERAFGNTYFRDIYSGVNDKFYKNTWKEFKDLENIDKKYYGSDHYNASLNKYGVKCSSSLRFWGNKGWIKESLWMVSIVF